MFLAAFRSALQAKPQDRQRKTAWLSRDLRSTDPHALQRCDVNAGFTRSMRPGALSSSLRSRSPQPEARISRFRLAFRASSSSRLPKGALDRTSHVADVQILDTDQVEPPGEVSAELLAPVSADVDLTSLELRDSKPDLGAASRSTLASRKLALEQLKPSLAARTQSRNFQQFAGGKRCARGDASIQAHDFTRPWARDCTRDDGECDVPAAGAVERNPVGLHPSRHRPRPSKPDPACLGDPDFPGAPD